MNNGTFPLRHMLKINLSWRSPLRFAPKQTTLEPEWCASGEPTNICKRVHNSGQRLIHEIDLSCEVNAHAQNRPEL